MACFHCDAKRPPDEFTENLLQRKQSGPRMRSDRAARVQDVSNAWNFDFDDNESDGADVAAFEFADSKKESNGFDPDDPPHGRASGRFDDDTRNSSRTSRTRERGRHFSDGNERRPALHSDRAGFDDFDDEEDDVDSYELDGSNNGQARDVSTRSFSEVDNTSDSEDFDDPDRRTNFTRHAKDYASGSEDDELADHPQLKSSHVAQSWRKSGRKGGRSLDSDDDLDLGSDYYEDTDDGEGFGSKQRKNRQQSSARKSISRGRRGFDSESDGDDNDSSSSIDRMRGSNDRRNNRRNSFGEGSRRDGRGGRIVNHDG